MFTNVPLLAGFRLSPIMRRRLAAFCGNRRAMVASYLFLALLVITLPAELIANDTPLVVRFDGQWYWPMLIDYPETAFGGFLPTTALYSDPAVLALVRDQGWLIQPPLPFSWQSIDMTLNSPAPAPPSLTHWLGTDDQGRDVLARVIYGFRLSVLFAGLVTLGSVIIGVIVGAVQGYFGGRVDLIGQRVIELWAGLPMLFILIILSSLVVPSVWWLALIMIAFSWLGLVDIVRAEFLRARNLDYVRAARAMGLPARLIMWRHVLPNAMVSTLTFLPFIFTGAITTLTALDFLGFGLPPGAPSLGELVAQGKNNLQAPWLGLTAFMTLAILLSLLVFIGEGLRDAFDPRHAAFSMGGRAA